MSLDNLAEYHLRLGYDTESLEVAREATHLWQDLAKEQPYAFNPHLAKSLSNLSVYLLRLGHREEGLAAVHKSLDIFYDLANKHPAAFNPKLAGALFNLVLLCLENDQGCSEGLVACREAEILYRALAEEFPLLYRSHWQDACNLLHDLEQILELQ